MAHYTERLTNWSASLQHVARWKILAAVAILGSLLIISRQPEVILHPRFWAEDGTFWYADAWNMGWTAIFRPHTGYLQTISRLTALVAVQFPLFWGPTIFVIVAWVAQLAPLLYWFSDRLDRLVPNWTARLFIGFLYIGLPNSYEVNMNLTNAQWHLALVSFLIIFADAPHRRWAQILDLIVLAIAGLSGPFSVLLWPIAAWHWYKNRNWWATRTTFLLTLTAFIQGLLILLYARSSRPSERLGASFLTLAKVVAGQIGIGSALGVRGYAAMALPYSRATHLIHRTIGYSLGPIVRILDFWQSPAIEMIAAISMTALIMVVMNKGSHVLKSFLAYALIVFSASLVTPAVSATHPQWAIMTLPGAGDRYYVIPILAWLLSLIEAAAKSFSYRALRLTARFLLVITVVIGIPLSWVYPLPASVRWSHYALRVQKAPVGTQFTIPIEPKGWTMILKSK